MEQRVPNYLILIVKDVVHQLVVGNYSGLVADGRARDWPVDALAETVATFEREEGAPLVDVPDVAFEDRSRGAVPLNDGSGWSVDVRLWSAKGPSLYTLLLGIDTTGAEPVAH